MSKRVYPQYPAPQTSYNQPSVNPNSSSIPTPLYGHQHPTFPSNNRPLNPHAGSMGGVTAGMQQLRFQGQPPRPGGPTPNMPPLSTTPQYGLPPPSSSNVAPHMNSIGQTYSETMIPPPPRPGQPFPSLANQGQPLAQGPPPPPSNSTGVASTGIGQPIQNTPSLLRAPTTGMGYPQTGLGQTPSVSMHPLASTGSVPPPMTTALTGPPTTTAMPPPPTGMAPPPTSAGVRPPMSVAVPPITTGVRPPPIGSMGPGNRTPLTTGSGVTQPTAGNRPPPTGSGMVPSLTGMGPPPTLNMGPPPPTASVPPPPTGLAPPPTSTGVRPSITGAGSQPLGIPPGMGPPPPSGMGPPPLSGMALPPTSGMRPPPVATGNQVAALPGSSYPPPPGGLISPSQMAPGPGQAGMMSGTHLGQRPGPQPGLGGMPPGPSPAAAAVSDPNLQPINIMETKDILPSTPFVPPRAVLPGNLSKFSPKENVFCSTMNAVPATNGMLNKLKLPLAIHIHPFKDMPNNECPVIHPNVIVRCRICRTYINPFATFVDSRHWRCNLCFRPNTLPEDYDYNPQTGKRNDRSHRLELKRSSVEYIAPSEYMVRPPQPSVYYFVIDVTYNTIEKGLLGVVCRTLLDNLDRLPGDARTLIGIMTFDSTLHFYNLKSSLSQPQMLVVSDVDDVFLPSPDSLLVSLKESKELVRTLLEDLPRMFAGNRSVQCALGPALQAASKLLHPIGGRVTVMLSNLPNLGPGSLKYRDIAPSSMKMNTLSMSPGSDFYKKLALECSSQQIAVDVFAFCGMFTDLPTVSCVSKFSAGQIFHYPEFHHSKKIVRRKFEMDFKRYLTRKIGYEAVMRIRCTDGLSLHTFHGNFFVRSTDLLSLPNVNPDHGYTINIAIDENLKDLSTVCFQAALLYTSSKGERRIRVHTLCLPVATQLPQVYANLNVQAIIGVVANMAVDRSSSATLGDARDAIMNVPVDATKVYRSNCASSLQSSQFVLPATIRLLPLFTLSLVKNPAFTLSQKVSYDARSQAMNLLKTLPLDYLMCRVYPRLYALHTLSEQVVQSTDDGRQIITPPRLRLTAEKLTRNGMYLMDYGLGIYIWVSKECPPNVIQAVLGVQHFGAIPEVMIELPTEENDLSELVRKFVRQIRVSRQHFMPIQVIREDGPQRLEFINLLIEDRNEHGTSYYELLQHLKSQLGK